MVVPCLRATPSSVASSVWNHCQPPFCWMMDAYLDLLYVSSEILHAGVPVAVPTPAAVQCGVYCMEGGPGPALGLRWMVPATEERRVRAAAGVA